MVTSMEGNCTIHSIKYILDYCQLRPRYNNITCMGAVMDGADAEQLSTGGRHDPDGKAELDGTVGCSCCCGDPVRQCLYGDTDALRR